MRVGVVARNTNGMNTMMKVDALSDLPLHDKE